MPRERMTQEERRQAANRVIDTARAKMAMLALHSKFGTVNSLALEFKDESAERREKMAELLKEKPSAAPKDWVMQLVKLIDRRNVVDEAGNSAVSQEAFEKIFKGGVQTIKEPGVPDGQAKELNVYRSSLQGFPAAGDEGTEIVNYEAIILEDASGPGAPERIIYIRRLVTDKAGKVLADTRESSAGIPSRLTGEASDWPIRVKYDDGKGEEKVPVLEAFPVSVLAYEGRSLFDELDQGKLEKESESLYGTKSFVIKQSLKLDGKEEVFYRLAGLDAQVQIGQYMYEKSERALGADQDERPMMTAVLAGTGSGKTFIQTDLATSMGQGISVVPAELKKEVLEAYVKNKVCADGDLLSGGTDGWKDALKDKAFAVLSQEEFMELLENPQYYPQGRFFMFDEADQMFYDDTPEHKERCEKISKFIRGEAPYVDREGRGLGNHVHLLTGTPNTGLFDVLDHSDASYGFRRSCNFSLGDAMEASLARKAKLSGTKKVKGSVEDIAREVVIQYFGHDDFLSPEDAGFKDFMEEIRQVMKKAEQAQLQGKSYVPTVNLSPNSSIDGLEASDVTADTEALLSSRASGFSAQPAKLPSSVMSKVRKFIFRERAPEVFGVETVLPETVMLAGSAKIMGANRQAFFEQTGFFFSGNSEMRAAMMKMFDELVSMDVDFENKNSNPKALEFGIILAQISDLQCQHQAHEIDLMIKELSKEKSKFAQVITALRREKVALQDKDKLMKQFVKSKKWPSKEDEYDSLIKNLNILCKSFKSRYEQAKLSHLVLSVNGGVLEEYLKIDDKKMVALVHQDGMHGSHDKLVLGVDNLLAGVMAKRAKSSSDEDKDKANNAYNKVSELVNLIKPIMEGLNSGKALEDLSVDHSTAVGKIRAKAEGFVGNKYKGIKDRDPKRFEALVRMHGMAMWRLAYRAYIAEKLVSVNDGRLKNQDLPEGAKPASDLTVDEAIRFAFSRSDEELKAMIKEGEVIPGKGSADIADKLSLFNGQAVKDLCSLLLTPAFKALVQDDSAPNCQLLRESHLDEFVYKVPSASKREPVGKSVQSTFREVVSDPHHMGSIGLHTGSSKDLVLDSYHLDDPQPGDTRTPEELKDETDYVKELFDAGLLMNIYSGARLATGYSNVTAMGIVHVESDPQSMFNPALTAQAFGRAIRHESRAAAAMQFATDECKRGLLSHEECVSKKFFAHLQNKWQDYNRVQAKVKAKLRS